MVIFVMGIGDEQHMPEHHSFVRILPLDVSALQVGLYCRDHFTKFFKRFGRMAPATRSDRPAK
jgi:hypothetical protein